MGQTASKRLPNQKVSLLLVDCQKDFHPGGSLAIPTANDDAERIAQLIRDYGTQIDRIIATMDTHLKLHIAHPSFWVKGEKQLDDDDHDHDDDDKDKKNQDVKDDENGDNEEEQKEGREKEEQKEETAEQPKEDQKQEQTDEEEQKVLKPLVHPEPFTIITAEDVRKGVWKPRPDLVLPGGEDSLDGILDLPKYCLEYVTRLEEENQFQLCIWPEHCLLGTEGHALVPTIQQALHYWSEETGRSVEFVCKGQNILTEMYSAFQAAVPVSPDTALNRPLLDSLVLAPSSAPKHFILVCGQAMSHCVNYTVRDLVQYWETTAIVPPTTTTTPPTTTTAKRVTMIPPLERSSQIAILTDCASSVPGFEKASETFLKEMKAKGVYCFTSSQIFFFSNPVVVPSSPSRKQSPSKQ